MAQRHAGEIDEFFELSFGYSGGCLDFVGRHGAYE